MLHDLWYDARPYLGHSLIGMALGLMISTVLISLIAATFGVTGEVFLALCFWVLGLFVAGAIVGAAGIVLYMSPYDRKEWNAGHAQRPANAR